MSWFTDNAPPPDPNAPTAGTYTGGGRYPLASVMGTGLMQPWTTPFNAPGGGQPNQATMADPMIDPGFAFRLQEGQKAIERSKAAQGTLLSGGALKALNRFGQDYSSNEWGNAYNRARGAFENDRNFNEGSYQSAYNRAKGEYDTAYNIFGNNQNTQFGRLSALAGAGQNAAGTMGQMGSAYGNQTADLTTGAGNAAAGGTVGGYNAWAAGLVAAANVGQWALQQWLARNPQPKTTTSFQGSGTGFDPKIWGRQE